MGGRGPKNGTTFTAAATRSMHLWSPHSFGFIFVNDDLQGTLRRNALLHYRGFVRFRGRKFRTNDTSSWVTGDSDRSGQVENVLYNVFGKALHSSRAGSSPAAVVYNRGDRRFREYRPPQGSPAPGISAWTISMRPSRVSRHLSGIESPAVQMKRVRRSGPPNIHA